VLDLNEQQLADFIEESVQRYSFKKMDTLPVVEHTKPVAIWTYKSLFLNRGIALVVLDPTNLQVGDAARAVKQPIGKAIGYIPLLHTLGLQIIILGRGVLVGRENLHRFLDTVDTGTVVLQSIHVVDTDASRLFDIHAIPSQGLNEDLGLPKWLEDIEKVHELTPVRLAMRAIGKPLPPRFEGVKVRLNFSKDTGRAAFSVRTWGLTATVPIIDVIEKGIHEFVASR